METDITLSNNYLSLEDISDINIDNFIKIKEIILKAFKIAKINPDNKNIYYQRQSNGSSILAIKVENGLDDDLSNYMINGSVVNYYRDRLSCDVYLHADSKSAQKSLDIARLITKDIVKFFEETEEELLLKSQTNSEFSIRIPLSEIKEQSKKDQTTKSLLKRIFRKSK